MAFGHEHNGGAGGHDDHYGPRPMPATLAAPEIVSVWRKRALIIFVVATILTIPFAFTHEGKNHILRAYLMGYMTCFGFAGGDSTAALEGAQQASVTSKQVMRIKRGSGKAASLHGNAAWLGARCRIAA